MTLLDGAGARSLDHGEIAKLVHANGASEWWAQSVAVAYEQHIGRRQPGQNCDGDFQVTVSKTLPGTMDEALARWAAHVDGVAEFDGVAIGREPSVTETPKWRYWRCGLADGSSISVNIAEKAGGKSTLSVNHTKLADAADVDRWRTVWKAQLAEL